MAVRLERLSLSLGPCGFSVLVVGDEPRNRTSKGGLQQHFGWIEVRKVVWRDDQYPAFLRVVMSGVVRMIASEMIQASIEREVTGWKLR